MPILFPEIWLTVVSLLPTESLQDRVHLWIDCRRVCKLFKYEVEEIFAKQLLQRFEIKYDLGYRAGGITNLNGTTFAWFQLSKDHQRAIFKEAEPNDKGSRSSNQQYQQEVIVRLHEAVADSCFCYPPHYLKYRQANDPSDSMQERRNGKICYMARHRETSDTELPALKLNRATGELSFDWKGMVSRWYAEERLWSSLWKEEVS